jgi:transposase
MENLPNHHVSGVRETIEGGAADLRFLPAHSPDLNPIETPLSKLKPRLRKLAKRTIPGL